MHHQHKLSQTGLKLPLLWHPLWCAYGRAMRLAWMACWPGGAFQLWSCLIVITSAVRGCYQHVPLSDSAALSASHHRAELTTAPAW